MTLKLLDYAADMEQAAWERQARILALQARVQEELQAEKVVEKGKVAPPPLASGGGQYTSALYQLASRGLLRVPSDHVAARELMSAARSEQVIPVDVKFGHLSTRELLL